ncbi:MAG TPA: hypothetical protein VGO00_07530, partial [Kofleriaceae bacterium]|nr:hypothetical protein [Kofleriaceae bacterium]
MRATLIVVLVGCAAAPAPPPAAPPPVVEHHPAPAPPVERIASPATAAVVAKLDDPREAERAIDELVQLGDPDAIPGLGAAWITQGKPVRILAAIIALAKPRAWDRAMPFMIRALADIDPNNPRSVDSAAQAAEAMGEARLPGAIDALIGLSRQPVSKTAIIAEVSAIRALGHFAADKPKVAAALVAIIERELPPHPKPTNDAAREEPFALALASAGAAINALAELRTTVGIDALVLAMYRMPELFTQIQRALVASGPAAETVLVHVLRGDHAAVNALFKAKSLDRYCDPGGSACEPVSAKDFYPAAVLGDFHDDAIVPDLMQALERKPAPVYFYDDQPSPNTQHTAIFDALRKLGSTSSAASVRARWIDPKVDVQTRILAVATYPFVVRDAADVDQLGAIAADNTADDNLRQEAATAFARLARSPKDISLLQKLAKRYLDASTTKAKEAVRFKSEADTADREFEAQRAIHDKARDVAGKTADQIRAATVKADADFRVAKRAHSDRVSRFKNLD